MVKLWGFRGFASQEWLFSLWVVVLQQGYNMSVTGQQASQRQSHARLPSAQPGPRSARPWQQGGRRVWFGWWGSVVGGEVIYGVLRASLHKHGCSVCGWLGFPFQVTVSVRTLPLGGLPKRLQHFLWCSSIGHMPQEAAQRPSHVRLPRAKLWQSVEAPWVAGCDPKHGCYTKEHICWSC